MNQKSFHITAAVFALVLVGTGIGASLGVLPRINTHPDFAVLFSQHDSANWIGQGDWMVFGNACIFVGAVYCLKWNVIRKWHRRPIALFWYAVIVAGSLPYIWFLRVSAWPPPPGWGQAGWYCDPMVLWFIPTWSFLIDMDEPGPPSVRYYVIRSCIEVVLLPLWIYVAAFLSLIMGMVWI